MQPTDLTVQQPAGDEPNASTGHPVHADDPSALLNRHFLAVWQAGGVDLAPVNPALQIEAVGFIRYAGDWVGVVVTPWFFRLFLLPGGGSLWGDIPAGQRRYLQLPGGVLPFTAEELPAIGPCQWTPLIEPITAVSSMGVARQAALDALRAAFAIAVEPLGVSAADNPRRGFLRRLGGRR
jgi:[NiFe] hydrogenase assembly HybE family chaperone